MSGRSFLSDLIGRLAPSSGKPAASGWFGRRARLRARRWTESWRRRTATTTGAVALGLVALGFAANADDAQRVFLGAIRAAPSYALAVVPLAFAGIALVTRRWAPEARGSGIPQVIADSHNPSSVAGEPLTSLRTAAFKYVLTLAVLAIGGSVGREGPTVQISAAIMKAVHRMFRVDLTAAVVIAGAAAGVSAAFNTPLAGVAFAIEELAATYEQRLAVLTMAAVMISGLVSLGLAGDYLYFGAMHERLSLAQTFVICPVAGVGGGVLGGLFSLTLLRFGASTLAPLTQIRRRPILWAAACGAVVAAMGYVSQGATWGTGYAAAKLIVEGHAAAPWFGPAKILVTLMTALSGVPGGIFAPSLSAGAGIGAIIAGLFPSQPAGAVALLGMIGYFVGVVRSPLTAVLIVSEMTDSRQMILPLVATAIIADGVSALICGERLYHGLSKSFRPSDAAKPKRRL